MSEFDLAYRNNAETARPEMNEVSETLRENIEKIKNVFLNARYPLSAEGEQLKAEILAGKYDNEQLCHLLPTVENPRSGLFVDLNIDEENKAAVFGPELSIIQTTKGCSHQCKHCAIAAGKKIETMPFPAVVKCAEAKHLADIKIAQEIREYITELEKITGYSRLQLAYMKYGFYKDGEFSKEQTRLAAEKVREFFANSEFKATFYGLGNGRWIKSLQQSIYSSEEFDRDKAEEGFVNIPVTMPEMDNFIVNYFDSDPFDYKDPNFLHEDGTPANYGDVYRALSSRIRHAYVLTAGWAETNKDNNSATQDMFNRFHRPKEDFRGGQFTLSVSKYEHRYDRNPETYLRDTLNVLKSVVGFGIKVRLYDEGNDAQWTERVANPIREYIKKIKSENKEEEIQIDLDDLDEISRYSGRLAREGGPTEDDWDVMTSCPGVIIQPDGQILYHKRSAEKAYAESDPGVRPEPVDLPKLWEIER